MKIEDVSCPFCGEGEETMEHLFLCCNFAFHLWRSSPWSVMPVTKFGAQILGVQFPRNASGRGKSPRGGNAVGVMLTHRRLPKIGKVDLLKCKLGLMCKMKRFGVKDIRGAPTMPTPEVQTAPAPLMQVGLVIVADKIKPLYEWFHKQTPLVILGGSDVMKAEQ
uniref:Reverse transcriptase zinc-binding domain-containing protein n=1 Tax=Cannabis sativa TaxID=3483 RepID=A0A803PJ39_CANSA